MKKMDDEFNVNKFGFKIIDNDGGEEVMVEEVMVEEMESGIGNRIENER